MIRLRFHLRKIPGCAIEFVLSPLDPTLKLAVGEGVAFVEVQAALISEEAFPCTWINTSKVFGGDQGGREVDEVFPPWLELEALLSHHWELVGGSYEEAEGTMLLVKGAKGHWVGVKIERETQSVLSTCSQFYLLCLALPLHRGL